MSSVSFFDTSAQADEATRVASNWVRDEKLETALPECAEDQRRRGRRPQVPRARQGVTRLGAVRVGPRARARAGPLGVRRATMGCDARAALRHARRGRRPRRRRRRARRDGARAPVVMTEESDWLGGQLTSQAVPPDEHRWIERFGCTASYRALRDGIRAHYRAHYPLTERGPAWRELNPGAGTVSAALPRAAGRARGHRGDARARARGGRLTCCCATRRSRADVRRRPRRRGHAARARRRGDGRGPTGSSTRPRPARCCRSPEPST